MKYQDKLLALSISLAMTAMPAMAASKDGQSFSLKPFVSASVGYQLGQDQAYSHNAPAGMLYQLNGGVQFSKNWRWDLGYLHHDNLHADATSVTVNTSLFESAVRYDWVLHNNLSLYGRLGLAHWNMDKTKSSLDTLKAKGFSPLGEVGVNYRLTPSVDLSLGYQYINAIGNSDTGKYDSHGVLFGLAYTFGRKEQNLVSF